MADLAEPSSRATKIASSALIVMAGYLASRVLGLVREMVIGARFGTSGEYDAYVAAFRIPDLLFLLLMGGALASSFIPVFTGYLARNDSRRAWRLATYTINGSLVVLVAASAVTAVFAGQLVPWLIAPGMSPPQQALAVDLTRILLLSPLFLGLGGIAMGILNSHQSFLLPAFAPVAYNIFIIFGAVALVPFFGVRGLAMGVVLGAAANFLIQVPGLRRLGFKYTSALNTRDRGLRKVLTLLLPRLLGQAAFQINFIVITNIASRLAVGSVSALNYAYLLMLLPHGVFALSLSAVVFPQMALQYGGRQIDEMRDTLSKGLKTLLFLTLPSAVGLMILREPVVRLLLQFGSFTGHSTEMVAWALLFFSAGIPAYAVVEIMTRAFYALHDTKTPVFASVTTIAVNIVLS
ncbi:MAG: murein biosynthesis integral membrane protein MurJ, partial [Chloroflexi bacterium]|nr:murein biosynthesis integral membrane protein MurJ [Chloroflexota bacterium]